LGRLLVGKPSTKEISAWVEDIVATDKRGPSFIATLTTQIMKTVYEATTGNAERKTAGEDEEALIKDEEAAANALLPLLLKYSEPDASLPLHVVCAAQAFAHAVFNPKGTLCVCLHAFCLILMV